MEARDLAAVGLSLMLAANCFMPCYTLAYADESIDGGASYEQLREDQQERPGDGQAYQGPDFQGLLWYEVPEEASLGSEHSSAFGAGCIRPFAHVLVEALYSLVDSLIRFASVRAYADESQEVEARIGHEGLGVGESVSDAADGGAAAEGHSSNNGASTGAGKDTSSDNGEVAFLPSVDDSGFSSKLFSYLDDIVYLLGEIADYHRSGSGVVEYALSTYEQSVVSSLSSIESHTDLTSARLLYRGALSGNSTVNSYALSHLLALCYNRLYDLKSQLTVVNSSMKTTHTFPGETAATTETSADILWRLSRLLYDDSSKSSLAQAVIKGNDILAKQWGIGYGGTVVTYDNSPASFLRLLARNSVTSHTFPGETSMTTEGSANILWRITRLLWDDDNKQSVITSLVGSGDVLRTLRDRQVTTHTFPGESSSTTEGSANILWRITRLLWDDDNKQSVITSLVGSGDVLRTLRDRQVTTHTFPGESSSTTEGSANILWRITRLLWDDDNKQSVITSLVGSGDVLRTLRDTQQGYHSFGVSGKYENYTTAEVLWRLWLLLRESNDYQVANGNLVTKGFSDVLDKLDNLSVSVEVDLSGVESRLDSIIRLLTVAGVVENAKDFLDAIFGDMSLDATGAASAAVSSAIQNAFPFCVPAVLKQILGLLQADPAPPEFHFDFWGAPLEFGFSDWQGLADMTSWLSRIGFAVMLFANSRRFVYSGGVAGD